MGERPAAVVFGEALIDVFPDRRVVAGAALHVAVRLARLGWSSSLLSRVGSDPEGQAIREVLRDEGVDTGLLQEDPLLPSGLSIVSLGDEPHFEILRPAAWDVTECPDRLAEHRLLSYTGLALRGDQGRRTLVGLLERSRAGIRLFDLTLRPPHVHPEGIRLGLEGATVLKGNESEFETVKALGLSGDPVELFRDHPALRWICITAGPAGARLLARSGEVWEASAPRVEVVDTVGAGDALTAGLADGLGRGRSPLRALTSAVQAATEAVGRRGGL